MSSTARLLANSANARLSTGPRTEEGKARSSSNATRHGITARELVIRPDEQEQFDSFLAELTAELAPQGMIEQIAFNQIVQAAWNLQRIRRLEAEMIADSDLLDDNMQAAIERLARYQARSERTFHKSLKELRALQTERAIRRQAPAIAAAELPVVASSAEVIKRTQPAGIDARATELLLRVFDKEAEIRTEKARAQRI